MVNVKAGSRKTNTHKRLKVRGGKQKQLSGPAYQRYRKNKPNAADLAARVRKAASRRRRQATSNRSQGAKSGTDTKTRRVKLLGKREYEMISTCNQSELLTRLARLEVYPSSKARKVGTLRAKLRAALCCADTLLDAELDARLGEVGLTTIGTLSAKRKRLTGELLRVSKEG